jgi:signal transduction histidine kinase
MDQTPDISKTLISEEAIRQKLPSIFIDTIITDNQFVMSVVSQNILDMLEFTQDELKGKSINYLSDRDIAHDFKRELSQGYFDERPVTLTSKSQKRLVFGASAFYLGLISELNGRIIFSIRSFDKAEELQQQLQARKAELDNFIYRAGHDLRGPLATIKGLVNLLKIRTNNDEVDRLVQLIDAHANTLDERLFQLVYLTQKEHELESVTDLQCCNAIETRLRKIIEKTAFVDFLELHFSGPETPLTGFNPAIFCGILENLLLYILALPMTAAHTQIFFRIEQVQTCVQVTIGTVGFAINDTITEALQIPDFVYTDLVKYPQMINFYSAQRRASQLHAKIKVCVLSQERQRIEVTVPLV